MLVVVGVGGATGQGCGSVSEFISMRVGLVGGRTYEDGGHVVGA